MKKKLFKMELTKEQVEWVVRQEDISKTHRHATESLEKQYKWLETQNHAMQRVLEALLEKYPDIESRGNLIALSDDHFLIMDKWYHKDDFIQRIKAVNNNERPEPNR